MTFIGYANNLTSFLIFMFGFKYNFRLWNFSQTCIIFGVSWLRKLREVKKCSMLMYRRQNPLYPPIQILNLGTFSYELNMVRLGHWHRRYHCMLCFACPSSFCLGFIWPPKNMVPSSVHSHLTLRVPGIRNRSTHFYSLYLCIFFLLIIESERTGALKHLNRMRAKLLFLHWPAFFLLPDAFFYSPYLIRTSVSVAGYSRLIPLGCPVISTFFHSSSSLLLFSLYHC